MTEPGHFNFLSFSVFICKMERLVPESQSLLCVKAPLECSLMCQKCSCCRDMWLSHRRPYPESRAGSSSVSPPAKDGIWMPLAIWTNDPKDPFLLPWQSRDPYGSQRVPLGALLLSNVKILCFCQVGHTFQCLGNCCAFQED